MGVPHEHGPRQLPVDVREVRWPLKPYLREQLETFLEAVDRALVESTRVVVIGGSAAALHYGATRATHDIDTWNTVQESLAAAAQRAREVTGLNVPLQKSAIADPPVDFESRLERVLPHLRRLQVLVPEKHDLVLMKTVRGYEHDLDVIEEIHAQSPLSLETLLLRFKTEMGAAMADPARLRGNFLVLVERLFPESVDRVSSALRK